MATSATDPRGTLQEALRQTQQLLGENAALAEEQAREIIKAVPGQPDALLMLGVALRAQRRHDAAQAVLAPLAAAQPGWALPHAELALLLAASGCGRDAVGSMARAIAIDPKLASPWRLLADELTLAGDVDTADDAYARHITASINDPRLMAAAEALLDNRLAVAERLLRTHLKAFPTDVPAIRMLAETGFRLGRFEEAELLLARCLELAPGFSAARHNYATVLFRLNKPSETLPEVDRLLAEQPENPGFRNLKAAVLSRLGDYEQAITYYRASLAGFPNQPKAWMSLGHCLKTISQLDAAIAAYRRSLALQPDLGETWWSLANLKTYRFTAEDVAAMQAQLARGEDALDADARLHLHFALGKALEDERDYAGSFEHYARGNALRHARGRYDPDELSTQVARARALFTPAFLAERAGWGCPAPDPIFIVGLPRSGSTLLEQILASHPAVEGTMELPDIPALVRRLSGRKTPDQPSAYPEILATLDDAALIALGEEFLARAAPQRREGRPFFIDKMPNNWLHTGMIQLILPNAKIIDARRHPLGCCFSGFKQHFARGQGFTYALDDIGRYYADYVRLMAHFDAVLPGRVHRVIYEQMVADPEAEVRRLLAYCGLPFEPATLRFHENARAVRTASSEQVRQPIFRDAVDHWRHYEAWLGRLKSALGPVLDAYPAAPPA